MNPSSTPVLAIAIFAAAFSCGGGAAPLVGKDQLAKQANIRASCDAAERGHDDPFTVEWDATDVASFEAQAQRDTVFVSYHGCDLHVLSACADPKLPGNLGAYGAPRVHERRRALARDPKRRRALREPPARRGQARSARVGRRVAAPQVLRLGRRLDDPQRDLPRRRREARRMQRRDALRRGVQHRRVRRRDDAAARRERRSRGRRRRRGRVDVERERSSPPAIRRRASCRSTSISDSSRIKACASRRKRRWR